LVERLTKDDGVGSLSKWDEAQLASFCNQVADFPLAKIEEIKGNSLVSQSSNVAINGKLLDTFGPAVGTGGAVASWEISKTSDKVEPKARAAWASKLKEGLGSMSSWSCTQMASMRTFAAGLEASDLSTLPPDAVKGVSPKSVTGMEADQVKGFTPEGFKAMPDSARKRVSGPRLEQLGASQMVAVVCGEKDSFDGKACPEAVVDVTLDFPKGATPSESEIKAFFAQKFPSKDKMQVEVLTMLPESERPVTKSANPAARRLKAASTEVTVRIGGKANQKMQAVDVAQSAASEMTGQWGGTVSFKAAAFSVPKPKPGGEKQDWAVTGKASLLEISLPLLAIVLSFSFLQGM